MDTANHCNGVVGRLRASQAGSVARSCGFLWLVLAWLALAAGPAGLARAEEPAERPKPALPDRPVKKAHQPSAIEHVQDKPLTFFDTFFSKIHLWKIGKHKLTKFMILEVVAAILIALIYIPLAQRLRSGAPARGGWQNAFETVLTFIRDDVAKPAIGEHDADRYLPFLWTLFLFVLFCNLLGMIPGAGSPTADIFVTGALALCSFIAIHASAIAKMGLVPYLKSLWPHLEIPIPVMGTVIKGMIAVIEFMGIGIKSIVLAVRLFANMFAGHMVLATILLFTVMTTNWLFLTTITFFSVLGVVALSLLELFVAFLQAYIFVFLTALFMGMSLHPQH